MSVDASRWVLAGLLVAATLCRWVGTDPFSSKIRPTGLAEGRSANPVDRSLMVTAFPRCALVELQVAPNFGYPPCTTSQGTRHVFGGGGIVCGLVLVAAS